MFPKITTNGRYADKIWQGSHKGHGRGYGPLAPSSSSSSSVPSSSVHPPPGSQSSQCQEETNASNHHHLLAAADHPECTAPSAQLPSRRNNYRSEGTTGFVSKLQVSREPSIGTAESRSVILGVSVVGPSALPSVRCMQTHGDFCPLLYA